MVIEKIRDILFNADAVTGGNNPYFGKEFHGAVNELADALKNGSTKKSDVSHFLNSTKLAEKTYKDTQWKNLMNGGFQDPKAEIGTLENIARADKRIMMIDYIRRFLKHKGVWTVTTLFIGLGVWQWLSKPDIPTQAKQQSSVD